MCAQMTATSFSRLNGAAGEALEEDAAERVDVGAASTGIALDLLGRDVVDRPDELARRGEPATRPRASSGRSPQ